MRWRIAMIAVALFAMAPEAKAQTGGWWLGGGLLMPSGDAADGLKSGFSGTAGIAWDLKSNWSLQVEGIMSSNSAKTGSADMTMFGVLGNIAYDWNPDAMVHPYAWAGLGMVSAKVNGGDSNSDMAWQAGGGFSWKASEKVRLWSDLKLLSVMSEGESTNFWGLTAGISVPFGTKK